MPKITVTISAEKCDDCLKCIEICPMEVFGKDEKNKAFVLKEKECIACNACVVQCPKAAIKVEEEK
ncbi:MAG: 4Fe-4S binding protein [Candidatus Woesearchaeota archaeon]|nr:4Fe-4S binding protein [Candidatus Woesearchaeota archaeon]